MRLASVGNIASDLLYDSLLSAHLELARARAGESSEAVDFAQLLSAGKNRFKLQAVAQAAKPGPPVKEKEDKDKPKGKPSAPKSDWLSKEEYKAKMAAERAAKAAAAKSSAEAATRVERPPVDRPADSPRSTRRSRSRRGRSRSHLRSSPENEPMLRR